MRVLQPVFANHTALVTGSSRGVGKAIALRLARQGASVVINYVKQESQARRLVDLIRDEGGRAWAMCADVSKYAEVEAMITAIYNIVGEIDFLINNAGIHLDHSVKKMPWGDWQRVIEVNLTGTFNCCKCVLAQSALRLGPSSRIVNITSVVGQTGGPGAANYAASKAGIVGLTKSLARELARHDVTVNAVALGYIQTGMGAALPQQILEAVLQQVPLRRLGRPSEAAEAVAFLCSPQAGYITGSVLNVNGGIYT